jgi:hypothetical protein
MSFLLPIPGIFENDFHVLGLIVRRTDRNTAYFIRIGQCHVYAHLAYDQFPEYQKSKPRWSEYRETTFKLYALDKLTEVTLI